MKIKFGDLTVRQLAGFCSHYSYCMGCPFTGDAVSVQCWVAMSAMDVPIEVEIDLPDEEVKDDDRV